MQYLFTIFHRLNTGGTKLNNQEIRNCIYGGAFNGLLKELDQYASWRRLNKMKPQQQYRFTKQELILRFFAFLESRSKYEGQLAKFLNNYMHSNQYAPAQALEAKRERFVATADYLYKSVFGGKAPTKLSITVLEALLVGAGSNIEAIAQEPQPVAGERFAALIAHPAFAERALREGLSKKQRVIDRLKIAIDTFAAQP